MWTFLMLCTLVQGLVGSGSGGGGGGGGQLGEGGGEGRGSSCVNKFAFKFIK